MAAFFSSAVAIQSQNFLCCDLKENHLSVRENAVGWRSRPDELTFVYVSGVSKCLNVKLAVKTISVFLL